MFPDSLRENAFPQIGKIEVVRGVYTVKQGEGCGCRHFVGYIRAIWESVNRTQVNT